MIKNEYFIKRQDGKKSAPLALSVLRTSPDLYNEAKFVVQIIHGMFDCKERYLPFMTAIAEAGGIAVIHVRLTNWAISVTSATTTKLCSAISIPYMHPSIPIRKTAK